MPTNDEIIDIINQASGGFVNDTSSVRCDNIKRENLEAISALEMVFLSGNHKIKTLIVEKAPAGILIDMTRNIGKTCSLDASRRDFIYLVPTIMRAELSEQENVFKRHRGSYVHAFSQETVTFDLVKENQYLNQGEFGVAHLLYQLKIQATSLKTRNKTDAYNAAHELHERLSSCFLNYLNALDKSEFQTKSENNMQAYAKFKIQWNEVITDKKSELEKHRGWKNFLANLALGIVTLGIAHTGAAVLKIITGQEYAGKYGLFSLTKTTSAKLIDNLEQSARKIALNYA